MAVGVTDYVALLDHDTCRGMVCRVVAVDEARDPKNPDLTVEPVQQNAAGVLVSSSVKLTVRADQVGPIPPAVPAGSLVSTGDGHLAWSGACRLIPTVGMPYWLVAVTFEEPVRESTLKLDEPAGREAVKRPSDPPDRLISRALYRSTDLEVLDHVVACRDLAAAYTTFASRPTGANQDRLDEAARVFRLVAEHRPAK